MKSKLVRIGNSKGVRIPKTVIEQAGLRDEVELEVQDNVVIIRSSSGVRRDWAAQFKDIAKQKEDALLDDVVSTSEWDDTEWEWK